MFFISVPEHLRVKSSPLKPPESAVSSREKELEVSYWGREDICELQSPSPFVVQQLAWAALNSTKIF